MEWFLRSAYACFPGKCVVCLGNTHRQLDLCPGCQRELPRIQNPCWLCGLSNPNNGDTCVKCILSPAPDYSHMFSGFRYANPIDTLINQFKFNKKLVMGHVLSILLARDYIKHHIVRPAYWVPVPLHPQRLRVRGFNQAEKIAQVLAAETNTPMLTNLVSRVVNTQSQKDLTATSRQTNVQNAFCVERSVDGLSIGIVDDVVTTGATTAEMSRVLLHAGASDVQIVSLARTPEK